MTTIVNIHEAKTHLSRLVEQAVKGHEFVIAKAGKPMVRVSCCGRLTTQSVCRAVPPVCCRNATRGWCSVWHRSGKWPSSLQCSVRISRPSLPNCTARCWTRALKNSILPTHIAHVATLKRYGRFVRAA